MFPDYLGYGYGSVGCISHGSLKLTATSPVQTFAEPFTLDELKSYLSLTAAYPADDDTMLTEFISAAREIFEIEQGRDLIAKQYDLTLDGFGHSLYELGDDLISVDLVRYRDSDGNFTALTEGTDYVVNTGGQPGIIAPTSGNSWPSFTPWPSGSVLIRFTRGLHPTDAFWNDEGARLKTGMKILCKAWFIGDESAEKGNQSGIPWAAHVLAKYGSIPRVG